MNLSFLAIVIFLGQALYAGPDINRIVGDNDLVLVDAEASNIPVKYRNLVDAFGLLSTGCTVTHIGGGYVLTAAHCFFVGDQKLHRDLNCSEIRIEWGVRDGITPYLVSTCEEIKAIQHNGRSDFAILKVSPAPEAAVEVDFTNRPLAGDFITIFSHPEELPLHWSKSCVVEASKKADKLPAETLLHGCDTKPVSSGAGVIDTTSLKVVGIHGGGITDDGTTVNYASYLSNPEIADILKELGFK